MAKICDVRFTWKPSPTAGLAKTEFVSSINGTETRLDVTSDTAEHVLAGVPASASVTAKIVSTDGDGLTATSPVDGFVVPDLLGPVAASGVAHQLFNIRDDATVPAGG